MHKTTRQLRDYQKEGVEKALSYLKENKFFRFNMIVGSGKTVMAIHAANILNTGRVIVAVHTNVLRRQFLREIKKEFGFMPNDWEVYTYQSLRNVENHKCYTLIVDEVHQGGLTEDGSYLKIIKTVKPEKVLSLSATDTGVQESLFGEKTKENCFLYGLERASQEGIVNDCEIITVDTGLSQVLSSVEMVEGKTVEEVREEDLNIGVDLKGSAEAINKAAIICAISAYKEAEEKKGFPLCLMFVPNIFMADFALEKCKKAGLSAEATYSGIGRQISREAILKFKSKKIKVLVNIRRMQEGFDFPELEVIMDTCPSFSNDGRVFIQRLGRALRKAPGKEKSRYYITNKVTSAIRKPKLISEHLETRAEAEFAIKNDLVDNKTDFEDLFIDGNHFKDPEELHLLSDFEKEIKGLGDAVTFKTKPSMARSNILITRANKYAFKDKISIKGLLVKAKKTMDDYFEELYQAIREKKEWLSLSRNVRERFAAYIFKDSPLYSEEFSSKVEKLGCDWRMEKIKTVKEKKAMMIAELKNGGEYPAFKTKEYNFIQRHASAKGKRFDKEFRAALEPFFPDWVRKDKTKIMQDIISTLKEGELLKGVPTQLFNALRKNEWFLKELKKIGHGLEKGYIPYLSFVTLKKHKNEILALTKEGKTRKDLTPHQLEIINKARKKESEYYDKEFIITLKALNKKILGREWNVEEKQERMLKLAREGKNKSELSEKELAYFYGTKKKNKPFYNKLKKIRPEWFKTAQK